LATILVSTVLLLTLVVLDFAMGRDYSGLLGSRLEYLRLAPNGVRCAALAALLESLNAASQGPTIIC